MEIFLFCMFCVLFLSEQINVPVFTVGYCECELFLENLDVILILDSSATIKDDGTNEYHWVILLNPPNKEKIIVFFFFDNF